MEKGVQIYDKAPEIHRMEVFTVNRCMQFFIGWMKRFGYTKETFFVPLEQKSKSKPLRLRTLKQIGD